MDNTKYDRNDEKLMTWCFDVDGTLCSDTDGDYPNAVPNPDVIARVNKLYDAGHTIILYTGRGGTTGLDWRELTETQIKAWNVKHHKLIMGKPAGDVYVDDKCIHVSDFIQGVMTPKGREPGEVPSTIGKANNYYKDLKELMGAIVVTDEHRNEMSFSDGIESAAKIILSQTSSGHRLYFIGNGASAAISSHMAADFCKNGEMRAMTFNDASLLTCISNDLGYRHVFEKPIEIFADTGDVLIAISSSGKSENILRGLEAARAKQCQLITLSGLDLDNPLRSSGHLNFYVASYSYGYVEIIHHSICHCILDIIIKNNQNAEK